MGNPSLEQEVQELRKQIELLSAKETADKSQEPGDDAPQDEESDLSLLRTKVEEFMETLKQDLQDIPATTAVGIFALGVLMGRLLPR